MPSPDYALYIGVAYGVTALAVLALCLRAVLDHRSQVRALRQLSAAQPGLDPDD